MYIVQIPYLPIQAHPEIKENAYANEVLTENMNENMNFFVDISQKNIYIALNKFSLNPFSKIKQQFIWLHLLNQWECIFH